MEKNYLTKFTLVLFLCFVLNIKTYSQSFSSSSANWTLPAGGYINSSGTSSSFYQFSYSYATENGSQKWLTMDMNGDKKLDLVIYQEMQAGTSNVFGLPSNPYWKVYLGTDSGFSTTATNWALPAGGYINNGTNYSFRDLYGSTFGSEGSQEWVTTDINGDEKPDLVIYQVNQGGINFVYGMPSAPYWKVFLNTGTGFSTTATNWTLPAGGYVNSSGTSSSFYQFSYSYASENGSQKWLPMDMNGDKKLDLVIYQEMQAGTSNVFGLPSNPYWKVYLGTGSGFSTTATNWALPAGGYINNGTNYSFRDLYGSTFGSEGSQEWVTTDINGDEKPDLVIYQVNQGGINFVYGMPSAPYWKVFLNSGTGFSTTAINWTLPAGGYVNSSGTSSSFYQFSYSYATENGSQKWLPMDMNGDKKLDLVIYQEMQAGTSNVFGLPSNPYWKVYLGTGSGFSTTATIWSLPAGGYINNGTNYSFRDLYGSTFGSEGSQEWVTTDINGDEKPDLVIYQVNQGGINFVYGMPSAPYWKVFLNASLTGVQEFTNNENEFIAYPNPSSGKFIFANPNQIQNMKVEIYNITGIKIFEKENVNEIDISNFPKGIYFAKIYADSKIFKHKIVLY